MKIIYDRETDTISLIFNDSDVTESDKLREGIIVDYNAQGQVVSVEILDASHHTPDPAAISYEVREKTA